MVSTINSPAYALNSNSSLNFNNDTAIGNHQSEVLLSNQASELLKPLHIHFEEGVVSLAQWLGQSNLVSKLNYKINSARSFDNDRHNVALNFVLSDAFAANFVLLRGLFDFHSTPEVSVFADRTNKSFRVVVNSDDATRIISHFELIFNSLLNEINFKKILKGIIELEQRIKREQDLAYASLRLAV
jgi:hypothetical protein